MKRSIIAFFVAVLLVALGCASQSQPEAQETSSESVESVSQIEEGRVSSDGEWESPIEGLTQPVSELEEVSPGIVKLPEGGMFRTEYLAVNFDGSYSDDDIRDLIVRLGCEEATWYRSSGLNLVFVDLKLPEGADFEEEARKIKSLDEVDSIGVIGYDPDGYAGALADGSGSSKSGKLVTAGFDYGLYHLRASKFDKAYSSVMCNGAVTVAVLDSGAPNPQITEVAKNVDYAHMHDSTGGDGYDTFGHGTMLASIISARAGGYDADDDRAIDGASRNARILPVRIYVDGSFTKDIPFIGSDNLSTLWDGFDYLLSLKGDDFPDVVNMSFGVTGGIGGIDSGATGRMQQYIGKLVSKGAVCVAASGNDGGKPLGNAVHYPAACDNVISVGDLEPWSIESMNAGAKYDPKLAARSNTASKVDICAHGEAIKAIVPKGSAGGYSVAPQDGTSYSAALVSSAAALVKAKHQDWAPDQIEKALEQTAVKVSGMNGATRTDEYGYGALDVAAAVAWLPSNANKITAGSVSFAKSVSNLVYAGKAIKPGVKVVVAGKTLAKGVDYTVAYSKNINAGAAKVVVTGKGTYSGTATKAFKIKPRTFSDVKIGKLPAKDYTGKPQTQKVEFTYGDKKLKSGTDYTIAYSNNVNVGTATMVVAGKGNFTGKVSKSFSIKPYYPTFNYKVQSNKGGVIKLSCTLTSSPKSPVTRLRVYYGTSEKDMKTWKHFATAKVNLAKKGATGTITLKLKPNTDYRMSTTVGISSGSRDYYLR